MQCECLCVCDFVCVCMCMCVCVCICICICVFVCFCGWIVKLRVGVIIACVSVCAYLKEILCYLFGRRLYQSRRNFTLQPLYPPQSTPKLQPLYPPQSTPKLQPLYPPQSTPKSIVRSVVHYNNAAPNSISLIRRARKSGVLGVVD